eukprot:7097573-Alexandrium_andersonii.AAC.1
MVPDLTDATATPTRTTAVRADVRAAGAVATRSAAGAESAGSAPVRAASGAVSGALAPVAVSSRVRAPSVLPGLPRHTPHPPPRPSVPAWPGGKSRRRGPMQE